MFRTIWRENAGKSLSFRDAEYTLYHNRYRCLSVGPAFFLSILTKALGKWQNFLYRRVWRARARRLMSVSLVLVGLLLPGSCKNETNIPIRYKQGVVSLSDIKLYRSIYNLYPLDSAQTALKKTALDMALVEILSRESVNKGVEANPQILFYKDIMLPYQTAYRMYYTGWESKKENSVTVYTASHILRKKPDITLLEQIKSDIEKSKTTFEASARIHSEDKSTFQKGGMLPSLPESGWPESVVKVLETLNPGTNILSNPVKTEYGWHLFQLKSKDRLDTYGLSVKLYPLFEGESSPTAAAEAAAIRFIRYNNEKIIQAEQNTLMSKCGIKNNTIIPLDYAGKSQVFQNSLLKMKGSDIDNYIRHFEPDTVKNPGGKSYRILGNFLVPACAHEQLIIEKKNLGKDYKSRLEWDYRRYLADLWWKQYYKPDVSVSEAEILKDMQAIKAKKTDTITDAEEKKYITDLQAMPEDKLKILVKNKLAYLKEEKTKIDFITKLYRENSVKLNDAAF